MTKALSRIHGSLMKAAIKTTTSLRYLSPRVDSLWTFQGRPAVVSQQQLSSSIILTASTTLIRNHGTTPHRHHHGAGDHIHADLATTLKASGKKGMQITLIGLAANVGLTASKGVAGWYMNSASLLADAAHSLSDLLSDFVTLYTVKMSRKPPDAIYPYGYGKYETVGSFGVSTLLITGGIAIGFHSFDLLMTTLNMLPTSTDSINSVVDTISSMTSSSIDSTTVSPSPSSSSSEPSKTALSTLSSTFSSLFHHHHHHHDGNILDPNAAWFALASVGVKEWLYHATLKVGKSEHSDVLVANAWHHRSDAFSSMIALVAIGGSYAGIPVLDPLGGLLVSGFIVKSGASIMNNSVKELIDKGIPSNEIDEIKSVIAKVKDEEPQLVDFYSIRGRKLGPFKHLDMILQLDPKLPVEQAHRIEQKVRATVKKEIPMVQEILIHVDAEKQPPHH
ncbi:cation efflux family-domain-containing protein [Halteromyces radiatus]|uniref:cation efflux family-domain-containing protein n=1 Tax=Halteromyces radiatus TaxID=101107 RepID=UPI00221F63B9|nr:cation efflux family-domain-containing protein [Halteromyces radiatus]KAI8077821.1 cation efflux family-domain-containing protein [Halteromyces radiatus]